MKRHSQYIIVSILIIVLLVFGFVLMKERPQNIYTDQPTPTITPKVSHSIPVPEPQPCYNYEGVETECKG